MQLSAGRAKPHAFGTASRRISEGSAGKLIDDIGFLLWWLVQCLGRTVGDTNIATLTYIYYCCLAGFQYRLGEAARKPHSRSEIWSDEQAASPDIA